jgi:hypothetical protein
MEKLMTMKYDVAILSPEHAAFLKAEAERR